MAKTVKKSAPLTKDKETNFRSANHDNNDKESITSIKAAKKQNEVIETKASNDKPLKKRK
ncbi:hypothetical protein [Ferruginibacter sp. HRS2-29]|uniref:hypothetical protein n=1 Tax=Ferruginibacter sp. HRS2-29 TaxID=2487334 RepID=UPI0020CB7BA4|nr:hypothetical protein [Ferruginibacter sp. HRS2-29]MCP9750056.1 hypothetical protein [Ferruginibacter sp. HRS2-29]